MVSFTYTAVVTVSLLSLIAPSMQGGALVKIGANLVGGLVGNHQRRDGTVNPGASKAVLKGVDPASLAKLEALFDPCVKSLKQDKTHELHLNKISKEAVMSGVNPSCIKGAEEAHKLPNWKEIAGAHGDIKIVNANTIKVTGIDAVVDKLLKADGAAPATAEAKAAHAAANVQKPVNAGKTPSNP